MTDTGDLVREFYARIWNRHDVAAVPDLVASDFAFRGSLGQERVGRASFIEYVDNVHTALSEYHCEIVDLVVEEEKACARMVFSGVHVGTLLGYPATGRHVSWSGAAFFRVQGGKIAELWVLGDIHGLVQQLSDAK